MMTAKSDLKDALQTSFESEPATAAISATDMSDAIDTFHTAASPGGAPVTGSDGRLAYIDSNVLVELSALNWDSGNSYLELGTTAGTRKFNVNGAIRLLGGNSIYYDNDEAGDLYFSRLVDSTDSTQYNIGVVWDNANDDLLLRNGYGDVYFEPGVAGTAASNVLRAYKHSTDDRTYVTINDSTNAEDFTLVVQNTKSTGVGGIASIGSTDTYNNNAAYQFGANYYALWATRRAGGTYASPSDTVSGNILGGFLSYAYKGGSWTTGGGYVVQQVSGWSGSNADFKCYMYTKSGATFSPRLTIHSTGDTYPGADLTYNLGSATVEWSNIYVQTVVESSDERLKENITAIPANTAYRLIKNLNPIKYRFKAREVDDIEMGDDGNQNEITRTIPAGKLRFGISAQDLVQKLDDRGLDWTKYDLVHYDENADRFGISYKELTPILIKATQVLMNTIDDLTARIEALESA